MLTTAPTSTTAKTMSLSSRKENSDDTFSFSASFGGFELHFLFSFTSSLALFRLYKLLNRRFPSFSVSKIAQLVFTFFKKQKIQHDINQNELVGNLKLIHRLNF